LNIREKVMLIVSFSARSKLVLVMRSAPLQWVKANIVLEYAICRVLTISFSCGGCPMALSTTSMKARLDVMAGVGAGLTLGVLGASGLWFMMLLC
jgi:hypothetical protein